jgi:hypothetical protein
MNRVNEDTDRTHMPSVPSSTANVIARRALREVRSIPMIQLRRECQKSMIEILDGLYEDGLPLNHEFSRSELNAER